MLQKLIELVHAVVQLLVATAQGSEGCSAILQVDEGPAAEAAFDACFSALAFSSGSAAPQDESSSEEQEDDYASEDEDD